MRRHELFRKARVADEMPAVQTHHNRRIPTLASVSVVVLLYQSHVTRCEKFSDVKPAQLNLVRARRESERLNALTYFRERELEPK